MAEHIVSGAAATPLHGGLWPTEPGTAHCPVASRSPIATVATNAGDG